MADQLPRVSPVAVIVTEARAIDPLALAVSAHDQLVGVGRVVCVECRHIGERSDIGADGWLGGHRHGLQIARVAPTRVARQVRVFDLVEHARRRADKDHRVIGGIHGNGRDVSGHAGDGDELGARRFVAVHRGRSRVQ